VSSTGRGRLLFSPAIWSTASLAAWSWRDGHDKRRDAVGSQGMTALGPSNLC